MKRILLFFLILLVVAAIAAAASPSVRKMIRDRNRPKYRTEEVTRGDITYYVHATGTIEPVLKVQIGSFVSGPITELNAEFNQKVQVGDLLAKVDPRLYEAAVARDKAALATAHAEVMRAQANLDQAINNEARAKKLREINPDYLADTELDQYVFSRKALEAQLEVAKLSVEQFEAQLSNSELNLEYTDIVATSDGIIIDRKIDPGQTLAAQFQTPELFVLAVDMNKRMWVHAGVVEADIGHILQAQRDELPVEFSVDAYEDELFTGKIHQVRQNPTTDSNVVTYPVIVETPNDDMKLMPGMTATMSFLIEERKDVVRIPGPALRYLPDAQWVREEDRHLILGSSENEAANRSAESRVEAIRRRKRRHVWTEEGEFLRAIEVEIGITEDGKYFELVDGDLTPGQTLVTGVEAGK